MRWLIIDLGTLYYTYVNYKMPIFIDISNYRIHKDGEENWQLAVI